jgi:UDP-N-acetylglucosamine:LPS N-acetylglucosamine transferase
MSRAAVSPERSPPEARVDRGVRVLIVSVDVGESHAVMAAALARDLENHEATERVEICSGFSMLGPALGAVLPRGFEFHLGRVQWSYDLAYRLFSRSTVARRAGESALYWLGGSHLLDTVERHDPDIVVSTYPVLNPILSRLRTSRRLACPVAAVVGPAGGLSFWVQPGIDLHLMLYAEALPEARRLAGEIAAETIGPLIAPDFLAPPDQARARVQLQSHLATALPAQRKLVVVSGGGWGAGDLAGSVRTCLELTDTHVVAVCGRNDAVRDRLESVFAEDPQVTVLGFTDLMPVLLAAADAFITSTAGISCLEARTAGCPTICFGFPFGHVRDNTHALARNGLARIATSPAALADELRAALSSKRLTADPWHLRPTAAELTIELARRWSDHERLPLGPVRNRASGAALSC